MSFGLLILSGCANHPLPDAVTNYSTSGVVQKLRCEAQAAIVEHIHEKGWSAYQDKILAAQRFLDEYDDLRANEKSYFDMIDGVLARHKVVVSELDAEKEALSARGLIIRSRLTALSELRSEPGNENDEILLDQYKQLAKRAANVDVKLRGNELRRAEAATAISEERRQLSKKIRAKENKSLADYEELLNKRDSSNEVLGGDQKSVMQRDLYELNGNTIALEIKFDIEERNDVVGTAKLGWPITTGAVTLGLDASLKKARDAVRVVSVQYTFQELSDPQKFLCGVEQETTRHAHVYPVVGNVGIGELVAQYFKVYAKSKVRADEDKFTDTLTFTTKVSAGVNPKVQLTKIIPTLDAGLDVDAARDDIHTVTVQLKPRKLKKSDPKANSAPPVEVKIIGGVDGSGRTLDLIR